MSRRVGRRRRKDRFIRISKCMEGLPVEKRIDYRVWPCGRVRW